MSNLNLISSLSRSNFQFTGNKDLEDYLITPGGSNQTSPEIAEHSARQLAQTKGHEKKSMGKIILGKETQETYPKALYDP